MADINSDDVMAAKDGLIFDLTNQVLQLKAQVSALEREAQLPTDEALDRAMSNGKAE